MPQADLRLSFVDDLEARARERFVRWDGGLWMELVLGPATQLGEALASANAAPAAAEQALRTYLELAIEAVGLGYLYPRATGRDSFFTMAWWTLLPRDLARLPAERWAALLAACWNLGENLEAAPGWLRRLFTRRLLGGGFALDQLETVVAEITRDVLSPPPQRLEQAARQMWVALGEEDRHFLPGTLHFVAPTVVCVHDRLRAGSPGQPGEAMGVWLGDPPLVLGAMRCDEQPVLEAHLPTVAMLIMGGDARVTEGYAAIANEWRAVLVQTTSQFLLAALPK
jgi:hypothetical protein